jgi:hypothetical protein
MATPRTAIRNQQPAPAPKPQLVKVVNKIVPLKIGFFGPQGSGKTTSAALLALALSVLFHNKAPVFVTDTEPGWQFLKRIFKIEGVELIQRTTPTFAAMLANIREAERLGAGVYVVDSLTVMWNELMQSFKKRNHGMIPINVWGDIKEMWGEYTTAFLNSPMHAFALGRLGNVMEEIEEDDKPGKTKLVKTGTQFKAGGGESFGYEPHLLLEMSVERKNKVKKGSVHEGEGRVIHRVDVLKDRTWATNGHVFRWSDKPNYQQGGFGTVFQSIKPHFEAVQDTEVAVTLEAGQDSTGLITPDGSSLYYQQRQRRDVLAAEMHASMDLLWGGQTKEAKSMRLRVFEHLFGFRTKEAADVAPLQVIERGVRILQAFEKRVQGNSFLLVSDADAVLKELDEDIATFDNGENVEELPF